MLKIDSGVKLSIFEGVINWNYTYFGTGVGLEGLGRLRISFERLVLQEASRDSTD